MDLRSKSCPSTFPHWAPKWTRPKQNWTGTYACRNMHVQKTKNDPYQVDSNYTAAGPVDIHWDYSGYVATGMNFTNILFKKHVMIYIRYQPWLTVHILRIMAAIQKTLDGLRTLYDQLATLLSEATVNPESITPPLEAPVVST